MAAKRRKKHKNKISGLVISMCYNKQKAKFSLFAKPSRLQIEYLWMSLAQPRRMRRVSLLAF
jgi:hypothetical protein